MTIDDARHVGDIVSRAAHIRLARRVRELSEEFPSFTWTISPTESASTCVFTVRVVERKEENPECPLFDPSDIGC